MIGNFCNAQAAVIQQEIALGIPFCDFFKLFPNFTGIVETESGAWPISQIQFSSGKEKLITKLGIFLANHIGNFLKIQIIGNTCAQGLFFPEINPKQGKEQFLNKSTLKCSNLLVNSLQNTEKKMGVISFKAEPFMVLTVNQNWNSFNDYLNAFSSKYRTRCKNVLNKCLDLQISSFFYSDLTIENKQICTNLLKETLKNKTIAMPKDLASVLVNFGNYFQENFHIHLLSDEKKIVGFISTLKIEKTLYAVHVGYDGEIAKEKHLYQRLLYSVVDFGIMQNCEKINFGRTATEIKSTLGAVPIENYYLVFVNNPILCFFTNTFKHFFYKENKYVIRNPFK